MYFSAKMIYRNGRWSRTVCSLQYNIETNAICDLTVQAQIHQKKKHLRTTFCLPLHYSCGYSNNAWHFWHPWILIHLILKNFKFTLIRKGELVSFKPQSCSNDLTFSSKLEFIKSMFINFMWRRWGENRCYDNTVKLGYNEQLGTGQICSL